MASILENRRADAAIPTLVVLLFFGYGIFSDPSPLKSARHEMPAPYQSPSREFRVRSRLWEDPLAVLSERAPDATRSPITADQIFRSQQQFTREVREHANCATANMRLLAVHLAGAPYSEDAENRLRQRYSILAALAVAGYEPADPESLGFVLLKAETPDSQACRVPFEWVRRRESRPQGDDPCSYDTVLVCYFDDATFPGAGFIKSTNDLASLVRTECLAFEVALLGPSTSDGLSKAIDVHGDPNHAFNNSLLIASQPSAARTTEQQRRDYLWLALRGLALVRSTTTDDILSTSLVGELRLRGVDISKSQDIIVLGEWDTEYSRSLYESFKQALLGPPQGLGQQDHDRRSGEPDADGLRRYVYLRGLDGVTSDETLKKQSERAAEDLKQRDSVLPTPKRGSTLERTDGQSQFDYLRRVAQRIKDDERDRRREVRAIGLFGNDFYDKLTILEALKPEFPGVLFFTTDLDARMLAPQHYHATRNLLVASAFDLRLGQTLQRQAPTFRDTYQTAQFLATLLALKDQNACNALTQIATPDAASLREGCSQRLTGRLFEIGRDEAVDLSEGIGNANLYPKASPRLLPLAPRQTQAGSWGAVRSLVPRLLLSVLLCALAAFVLHQSVFRNWATMRGSAHPLDSRRATSILATGAAILMLVGAMAVPAGGGGSRLWPLIGAGFAATGFCLLFFGLSSRGALGVPERESRCLLWWASLLGFVGCAAASAVLASLWWSSGVQREPFRIFKGVSVWPAALIYVLAAGTSVLYCAHFLPRWWKENIIRTCRKYRFKRTRDEGLHGRAPNHRRSRLREAQMIDWRPTKAGDGEAARVQFGSLWRDYTRLGSAECRAVRCAVTFALVAAPIVLCHLAYSRDLSPARDPTTRTVVAICYWAALLTATWATVFVWDAARLCDRFVTYLTEGQSDYSKRTLRTIWAKEVGRPDVVSSFLDVRLIADRTAEIGSAVIVPFVLIFLIIVARNERFDAWPWSWPLAISLALLALLSCLSAYTLRRAAERARVSEIKRLSNIEGGLIERSASAEATPSRRPSRSRSFSAQLEEVRHAIEEIKNIKNGAFSGWHENPLFQGVIIPTAGLLGIAIMEYIAKAL